MYCAGYEPPAQVIFPACHIRATTSGISRRLTEFGLNPGGYRVGQCVLPLAGGVQVDQRGAAGGVAHAFHQLTQVRPGLGDLQVEQITPPPGIAERLNLDPRTDVCVVRRHVRYIDGRPTIVSDDYFDERIVRGTELAEPEDTTRENILAEVGYEQVYDTDEIITRMPTPEEISRLGIPTGTPVAEHIRTGYTAENRPVRVMVSIVPGDMLIL